MLAVRLYHGRPSPDTVLEDWGTDGPHLGPIHGVHAVYGTGLYLIRDSDAIAELQFGREDGLVYYDGVYYGDIEVYTVGEEYKTLTLTEPVEEKCYRPC